MERPIRSGMIDVQYDLQGIGWDRSDQRKEYILDTAIAYFTDPVL